jgi:hypothetical protein
MMLYCVFHVFGCWLGLSFILAHCKFEFWVGLSTTFIFVLPIIFYKNEQAVLILVNLCSSIWTCIFVTLLVTNEQENLISWFKAYPIVDSKLFIISVCLLWSVIASLFGIFFTETSLRKNKN